MVDAAQQVARLPRGGILARDGGKVDVHAVLLLRADGALFRQAAQERERRAARPAGLGAERVGQGAARQARRSPELLHQRPFGFGQIDVMGHGTSLLFTFVTRV